MLTLFDGLKQRFVPQFITLFHQLIELFEFCFIPVLGFGYDQFLLFDLVIDTEFSACHYYVSFVLQDLRSSLMPTACLRTFVSARSNAFRIDFCVAVTA